MVFFLAEDRAVAVMSTFGVFALSFLVRPIGAIFWGNMGDKKGRKWALSVSILLMSGATFLIGCLPGYAVIGVGAPLLLLLLRMVQSFSAAGEYAGAATFIAEYAPHNHRGFYCSMVPASTATGLLVGSLLATFMFTVWGADSAFVVDWGWRIPFWLALPLGYITHYIRTHLEDSPVYAQMQERMKEMGEKVEHPIRTLFTKHLRVLLISFGACVLNAVGFYAVLTYLPNYLETTLNYPPSDASTITTIVLVVYIAFIFLSGRISDKVGRKKMLIGACVGFICVHSAGIHAARYDELLGHSDRRAVHVPVCSPSTMAPWPATSPRRFRPTCATPASPFRLTWRTPSSAARPRSSRSG